MKNTFPMTAEQAARAFFEACAREDWDEAEKFMTPMTDRTKEHLGGLKIVSLGESFTGENYRRVGPQGLSRPVCALRNPTAGAGIERARGQHQPGETMRGDGNL